MGTAISGGTTVVEPKMEESVGILPLSDEYT